MRSSDSQREIHFDSRSDLQDFLNCYLELEEEQGIYASVTIEGMVVMINSEQQLPQRFKMMVDEIAHETRGH